MEPIKSNDPNAIKLLRQKLEGLERAQAHMKACNKIYRSKSMSFEDKVRELTALGIGAQQIQMQMNPTYSYEKPGYPGWELTNNNATIRAVRQRITTLEETAQDNESLGMDDRETDTGEDWTLTESPTDYRIRFEFTGKPPAETRSLLKLHGFKWAPSIGVWQRHLNANGIGAAEYVASVLRAADQQAA